MYKAFKYFDKDDSGVISRDELMEALQGAVAAMEGASNGRGGEGGSSRAETRCAVVLILSNVGVQWCMLCVVSLARSSGLKDCPGGCLGTRAQRCS